MSALGEVKAALNITLADDAHWILELTKAAGATSKLEGFNMTNSNESVHAQPLSIWEGKRQ